MGVLVIDKPAGRTSFGVVKEVARLLRARDGVAPSRIGHGGTLDPMATGVLPVCVGEATKIAQFLLDADKEYDAEIVLGVETDTQDAEGTVTARREVSGVDESAVRTVLSSFQGAQQQTPPMFAALKKAGRPLYSYARAGETVERAARAITIHELAFVAMDAPDRVRFRVRCSKGTYVRVLAADIGHKLGTVAHLSALRRLASGPFVLDRAVTLETLDQRTCAHEPWPYVTEADALAHLPAFVADAPLTRALVCGQRVAWDRLGAGAPLAMVRIIREDGGLLAVAVPRAPDDADPTTAVTAHSIKTLRVFGNTAENQP